MVNASATFTPHFRRGTGEPLVLLHGGTGTWHVWTSLLDQLTSAHDVLAPTLPAHLGGPPLVRPATVAAFADGAERAMDEAGFDTAHLAGNSLGGWVAMELARRGRARSVVALSPAGGWAPDSVGRVRKVFVTTEWQLRRARLLMPMMMRSAAFRRWAFRNVALHGNRISYEDAMLTIAGVRATDYANGLPIFDTVVEPIPDPSVPVLLAWGERDRLLPSPRYSEAWRRAAPYAEWRVLPGVGHVPMIDDPGLVARTILEWWQQRR